MGNRKGIIYAALERLDAKMSIGESRYTVKQGRREAGEHIWAYSDETMHSYGSRKTYQQHTLAFIEWARDQYGVRRLEVLDARADELATEYLNEQLIMNKSAGYAARRTVSIAPLLWAARSRRRHCHS